MIYKNIQDLTDYLIKLLFPKDLSIARLRDKNTNPLPPSTHTHERYITLINHGLLIYHTHDYAYRIRDNGHFDYVISVNRSS